ncbi:MAG: DUF423 domain-containing protein [Chitinophagaceae bacterium]|nr:DUF423 domain-containing protein [Chitinophagaceae bacterium]
MNKRLLTAGALSGAIAVALGAFGAHSLKNTLNEDALRVFHTGVEYQFYHTLALLVAGIMAAKNTSRYINRAGIFFITGIILFSGSLYCMSMFPAMSFIGIITPIGGLCFITGWLLLGYSIRKTDNRD